MCNPKFHLHLSPKYWHSLRKEALANYPVDKVKVNSAYATIVIRYHYVHHIDADSSSPRKKRYDLRKSTTTQANGSIQRNKGSNTILIRKDYAPKQA